MSQVREVIALQDFNLDDALAVARAAALDAWAQIAHYFRGEFRTYEKEGVGPATDADLLADRVIHEHLRARYSGPEFGYLSEETADDESRLGKDLVWIIDPIDGTNDFIEGKNDFAIQIGLAGRNKAEAELVPWLGVVYQPMTKHLYWGALGMGAWRENVETGERQAIRVSSQDSIAQSRVVVTRSHMSKKLKASLAALEVAEVYRAGSLGVKTAQVAEGRADFYLNTGRSYCREWDTCAPEAILREAGGRMTDLLGRPILYNQKDVCIEMGLLASNGVLHQEVLDRVVAICDMRDS
ncbi:3'(2'),5'-bisphosphate nucleotidase CysQ [soil metagenome]